MSYWVSLIEDGGLVEVPRFREGGTHTIEGETKATLNITYNYRPFFPWENGIRFFHDKRAGDMILELERIVMELGTVQDPDYWEATPGNVGHELNILLGWARLYPDAVFVVD